VSVAVEVDPGVAAARKVVVVGDLLALPQASGLPGWHRGDGEGLQLVPQVAGRQWWAEVSGCEDDEVAVVV
jgi:hypothetical protein